MSLLLTQSLPISKAISSFLDPLRMHLSPLTQLIRRLWLIKIEFGDHRCLELLLIGLRPVNLNYLLVFEGASSGDGCFHPEALIVLKNGIAEALLACLDLDQVRFFMLMIHESRINDVARGT